MSNSFDKIVEQLRVQEAEFQSEVLLLKQKLASMTTQLNQVQAAIHSLSGKPAVHAPPTVKKAPMPSLTIEEIRQIVIDAKGQNQNIAEKQLFGQVETELAARGGKKHGLRAKFKKVLSELAEHSDPQQAGIKVPSM